MEIPRFDEWCSRAVRDIRHPADRKRVFRELREHMEDHYDDAMSQGLVHWKAVEETLEAMGDPEELAPMLAELHPPGWGRALDALRSLAAVLLAQVLVLTLLGQREPRTAFQVDTDLWFTTSVSADSEQQLLLHPGVSITEGDYVLTVTDAARWYTNEGGYPKREQWDLCLRLELTHPDPDFPESYAYARFWARDDLGNVYASSADAHWSDTHLEPRNHEKTGPGVWEWVYRIEGYDPAASWIELCYDDGGRSHVLHIDLTGGGEA